MSEALATGPSSLGGGPAARTRPEAWWRSAAIYQVYIRSFADGNGDGVGDIAGIRAKLPYIVALGVDAIWINPWYPSPMADAGYDVSDYRDIEPVFGTLDEAAKLIAEAHAAGVRIILDIVPNHTSDRHPWFQEALAADPGSEARDRYIFRDGRGAGGDEPPNDWQSRFGGPAWTRTTGSDGQWYLHLFAPEQPDVNWLNPAVPADFEKTLRFWFDRGVDGLRIDVAHGLMKQDGLPDVGDMLWPVPRVSSNGHMVRPPWRQHPHWDLDSVHDVYRSWRAIADEYQPPRVFVSEAWVDVPERLARYVRPDEVHTTFNFSFLTSPWIADDLRSSIDETIREHRAVGAPPTWVIENHDVARAVSRYARPQERLLEPSLNLLMEGPADFGLGLRRARAAALLTLALPGGVYVYQGQELGLPEVENLPEDALQDPTWQRSGHTERGRDGCRVPIPWTTDGPSNGFSLGEATGDPWLPVPSGWGAYSVQAQAGAPASTLELYRAALRIRREHPALGDGEMEWLDVPAGVLAFRREPGFTFLVNMSDRPLAPNGVLAGCTIVVTSEPLGPIGLIEPDVALWAVDI